MNNCHARARQSKSSRTYRHYARLTRHRVAADMLYHLKAPRNVLDMSHANSRYAMMMKPPARAHQNAAPVGRHHAQHTRPMSQQRRIITVSSPHEQARWQTKCKTMFLRQCRHEMTAGGHRQRCWSHPRRKTGDRLTLIGEKASATYKATAI